VNRTSILHPLLGSFFSRSLYRDVGLNGKGLGFLYLLILVTLSWIPAAVTLHRTVGVLVDSLGPLVLEQIPSLSISDGEVSLREPQPYRIKAPGSETPLAVIDTTGGTSLQDFPGAYLFVGRRQIVVRRSQWETRTYELDGIRSFTLDRSRLEKWGAWVKRWGTMMLFPFLLLGSYAYRILQALVYGAVAILFARVEKADLNYSDLVRLASVAVTPPILLDTLRGWMGWPTSYLWWFACFGIAMGYLFVAVRSCAPADGDPAAAAGVQA
jgi:hypothetical protein